MIVIGRVVESGMTTWHKPWRTDSIWEQKSQDLEALRMPTPAQGTNINCGAWDIREEVLEGCSEGPGLG